MAGVALGDIHLRFTRQAWYLATSSVDSAWQVRHLATCTYIAVCVAGVVLGDIGLGDMYVHSAWQVWYLATSSVDSAWHAWHLWHWAGSGGALGSQLMFAWQAWYLKHRASILRARCGTWRHVRTLLFAWQAVLGDIERASCVAGVALMALGWLWWRAWVPVDAVDAAAVCVAGVVLGDIERRFCVAGAALGDMYVHCCLRGRRGTWRHRAAWQAWHLWHWAGSGGALGSQLMQWTPRLFAWQAWYLATSSVDSAWCGTWRHVRTLLFAWQAVLGDIERAFCVAGVALMALGWLWWRAWVPVDTMEAAAVCAAGVVLGDIERRFCVAGAALGDMQAWYLTTSSADSAWQVRHLAICTFCVAGVVLGDIERRFCVTGVALMALGWLWWRAWVPVDAVDAAAFGVAGVALGDMDLHFAPQAWHLVTWIVILRGRRDTYGLALAARLGPS